MKLKCDEPLSNFAFSFNLRHYIKAVANQAVNQTNANAVALANTPLSAAGGADGGAGAGASTPRRGRPPGSRSKNGPPVGGRRCSEDDCNKLDVVGRCRLTPSNPR